MKVLITTDWYDPVVNGVVTSVHTLTEELEKQGHEVRVLTLSRNCRSYVEGSVYYVGAAGAGRIYPEARFRLPVPERYVQELIEWKPELIHSQCEFSTFFLARKIAGALNIPIIHTYHTIYEDYTHYFSPWKTWGRNVVRQITRRLSRQVSGMIPPEEVWKYYQAGDLFVSASTSETQGMTYVEALAAGLPLLCRRDGCLEGIVKEGENGWQYDDMKEFLAFLERWGDLDESGKRKLCKCARKSAERFSAETFGRGVERIYEQERKRTENLEYCFAGGAAPVRGTGSMGL